MDPLPEKVRGVSVEWLWPYGKPKSLSEGFLEDDYEQTIPVRVDFEDKRDLRDPVLMGEELEELRELYGYDLPLHDLLDLVEELEGPVGGNGH